MFESRTNVEDNINNRCQSALLPLVPTSSLRGKQEPSQLVGFISSAAADDLLH